MFMFCIQELRAVNGIAAINASSCELKKRKILTAD